MLNVKNLITQKSFKLHFSNLVYLFTLLYLVNKQTLFVIIIKLSQLNENTAVNFTESRHYDRNALAKRNSPRCEIKTSRSS